MLPKTYPQQFAKEAQKVIVLLGNFTKQNMSPRTFKNSPIW